MSICVHKSPLVAFLHPSPLPVLILHGKQSQRVSHLSRYYTLSYSFSSCFFLRKFVAFSYLLPGGNCWGGKKIRIEAERKSWCTWAWSVRFRVYVLCEWAYFEYMFYVNEHCRDLAFKPSVKNDELFILILEYFCQNTEINILISF